MQYLFACQKSQRSMPCNMIKSGLTSSRVFRRRHLGRQVTATSSRVFRRRHLGRQVTAVTCLRWPNRAFVTIHFDHNLGRFTVRIYPFYHVWTDFYTHKFTMRCRYILHMNFIMQRTYFVQTLYCYRVTHLVNELVNHWFRLWLVAEQATSHIWINYCSL